MVKRLLVVLLLLALSHRPGAEAISHGVTCEPIGLDMCKSVGYKYTTAVNNGMNAARQIDQFDVAHQVNSYMPLIRYNCSKDLVFLICAIYVPMCDPTESVGPIGPCMSLCKKVKQSCRPVLQKFGFSWPDPMDCSKFVDDSPGRSSSSQPLCLNKSHLPKPDKKQDRPALTYTTTASVGPKRDWWAEQRKWRSSIASGRTPPNCSHLRNSQLYIFINHSASCELACGANDLFSDDDKRLGEMWIATLAALCCASSLATLATFLIDRQRFRYPTRPVIIMSLCYMFYSMSYLLRLLAGREAAACNTEPISGQRVLTRRGLDNGKCAAVFLLHYFFGTAASAWFAILVLTWLLQSGLKWSPETLARRSCYLHFAAWGASISLTVCVLIVRRVEADELLGMCSAGQQDADGLLHFVILPKLVFLSAAVASLVIGFVATWRFRRHIRKVGQKTNKLDILMSKIGLFLFLYLLPTAFVCGVNVYEYFVRDLWHMPASPYRPSLALLLLREFASLAIGLTTILWIWSCKTVDSWRSCLLPGRRLVARKDPGYQVARSAAGGQQAASNCTYKARFDTGKQYCGLELH